MRNIVSKILVVAVLASIGAYVYANYLTACSQPLAYGIGTVDARFGITPEAFGSLAMEVEGVWEGPLGQELFRYDPAAEFKVNLVFDDRQQHTIDERNSRTEIQTQEQVYRAKVASYESALADYNQENANYNAAADAYETRLAQYNQQVEKWNQEGGAPSGEYAKLQQEKAALQRVANTLENRRLQLNAQVTALNAQAATVNADAKALNLDVNAYNGTFGTTREFDQGSYTSSAINIYQFTSEEDLGLVLAHEFGHALGVDHIDDPNAIMYYLMDKQNIKDLKATDSDLGAVRRACRIY